MIRTTIAMMAVSLSFALPAAAASVFYDDFSTDTPALQTNLNNFEVVGGIDVVGNVNPYGITTPGGNVVDLDRTTGPGQIISNGTYNFEAGDRITLSTLLGGSQRVAGATDGFYFGFYFDHAMEIVDLLVSGQFDLSLASFTDEGVQYSSSLSSDAGFLKTIFAFTATEAGALRFTIGTTSSDNIGPLVANVGLDITPAAVPVPAAGLLLLTGLGGMAALRRKRAA